MNKKRRSSLSKALDCLGKAYDIVEYVSGEEQDAFDNMPEQFQDSDRGEKIEDAINNLEYALTSIDNAVTGIEEAMT